MRLIPNLRLLTALSLIFSALIVNAAPAPFGFELGKATLEDVRKSYTVIEEFKNQIKVDPKELPLEEIKKAVFAKDENGILQMVLLTINKNRFNDIFESLSKKYSIESKEIPFVGNKNVKFKEDNCYVIINAPHLSFDMDVIYITENLKNSFEESINKTEKDRKKIQDESL